MLAMVVNDNAGCLMPSGDLSRSYREGIRKVLQIV